MTTTLEPKGKLDATKVVNGPEGGLWGCDAVSWRAAEENVRRLRQRIFTASQAGDLKRVRNLQKLMLRRKTQQPSTSSARQRAHGACLSRMHGNVPVRF